MDGGNDQTSPENREMADFNGSEPGRSLSELDQALHELMQEEGLRHPAGTAQRRIVVNRIVRLMQQSGKIWHERKPYYEDALIETWRYFLANLWEATATKKNKETGRRNGPFCEPENASRWLRKVVEQISEAKGLSMDAEALAAGMEMPGSEDMAFLQALVQAEMNCQGDFRVVFAVFAQNLEKCKMTITSGSCPFLVTTLEHDDTPRVHHCHEPAPSSSPWVIAASAEKPKPRAF